jgi:hypothetical protein
MRVSKCKRKEERLLTGIAAATLNLSWFVVNWTFSWLEYFAFARYVYDYNCPVINLHGSHSGYTGLMRSHNGMNAIDASTDSSYIVYE